MKKPSEITDAHDILLVALTHDSTGKLKLQPEDRDRVQGMMDILCWVLDHEDGARIVSNNLLGLTNALELTEALIASAARVRLQ